MRNRDLLVAMDKHNPQVGGHQPAPRGDGDVISLADVVDVDRDGRVCANAVFVHQGDKLRLCQVVWWICLLLGKLCLE